MQVDKCNAERKVCGLGLDGEGRTKLRLLPDENDDDHLVEVTEPGEPLDMEELNEKRSIKETKFPIQCEDSLKETEFRKLLEIDIYEESDLAILKNSSGEQHNVTEGSIESERVKETADKIESTNGKDT